ncbi:MAG: biotin--[acetyl-CoA-carboxylase] ligase [Flavobacterium sp.]
MLVIKLDAIESTNDYLKQLSKDKTLENFTIVLANSQTKGRGQMGTQWTSEPGKNLIMSLLAKDLVLDSFSIFDINVAVALSAAKTLLQLDVPNVKIKWPNDIMADSKKVGGILIENSLKTDGSLTAIIGIGINLNQTDFKHLPQASSLACVTHKSFDIDEFAAVLAKTLQKHIQLLPESVDDFWNGYSALLFRRNEIAVFEDKSGKRFNGIIQNVSRNGKLAILLEDDTIEHFDLKEIKMLY